MTILAAARPAAAPAAELVLLGAAPAAGAAALLRALAAAPGPAPVLAVAGGVALLAQPRAASRRALWLARDRAGLLRELHALQRRMEIACAAGPFLPADPGAASLPADALDRLAAGAAGGLAAALAAHGGCHQWDVVLRWSPEAALRRRLDGMARPAGMAVAEAVRAALLAERAARADALRAALAPAVLGIAAVPVAEEDAATGLTVLVPAGGEAAIEAALGALPPAAAEGAACDLRGPLPPIGFAALRVAATPPAAIAAAFDLLGLPDRLPAGGLGAHWRRLAAALHPDGGAPGADAARFAEAAAARHLLRDLAGEGALDRAALLARPPHRLILPEIPA